MSACVRKCEQISSLFTSVSKQNQSLVIFIAKIAGDFIRSLAHHETIIPVPLMGSACRDGGECERDRRLRVTANVAACPGDPDQSSGYYGPARPNKRLVAGAGRKPAATAPGVNDKPIAAQGN